MPEVREKDVHKSLLKLKGEQAISIGRTEMLISLNPLDVHKVGRPDHILWFESTMKMFGQSLSLKIPIPI